MNNDKTVSIRVISPLSCTHTDPPSPITCHGRKIKAVTKTQLLGVTVDNRLSWEARVDSIQVKVNRKIGALRRTYCRLTPAARRNYFTDVIQPEMQYASSDFVPNISENLKQRLLPVWRKAVGFTAGANYHDDSEVAISSLSITHIEHRWALQLAMIVRRSKLGAASSDLCSKISEPHTPMKQEANVSCWELFARHLGLGLYLSRTEHRFCGTVFRIMLGHLKHQQRGQIATRTAFFLTPPFFFTFLTSNFPTLFVLLNFIIWSGSFLNILSGKRKKIRKTAQNALAPSIFIVLSIVLKLGTPLLHNQAQNTMLQNF